MPRQRTFAVLALAMAVGLALPAAGGAVPRVAFGDSLEERASCQSEPGGRKPVRAARRPSHGSTSSVQSHSMIHTCCTPDADRGSLMDAAKASGAKIVRLDVEVHGIVNPSSVRLSLRLLEARRGHRARAQARHPNPRHPQRHSVRHVRLPGRHHARGGLEVRPRRSERVRPPRGGDHGARRRRRARVGVLERAGPELHVHRKPRGLRTGARGNPRTQRGPLPHHDRRHRRLDRRPAVPAPRDRGRRPLRHRQRAPPGLGPPCPGHTRCALLRRPAAVGHRARLPVAPRAGGPAAQTAHLAPGPPRGRRRPGLRHAARHRRVRPGQPLRLRGDPG